MQNEPGVIILYIKRSDSETDISELLQSTKAGGQS
jgi:hypothetical protein